MTTTTDTYYAICNADGPISVELDGSTVEEARAFFSALDGRAAIDAARTDAEDALDICGEGMGDHEFAEALESAGAEAVGPLGEVDQHGRAIAGDWYLWRVRAEVGEQQVHCECGRVTGERCLWSGPIDQTVVIEWMPPHLRASHQAAGNSGCYPANGAERLRVESACAEMIAEAEEGGAL